jgi:hypothetical protein
VSIVRDLAGLSSSKFPVRAAGGIQITPGSVFASILTVLPFSKRAPGPDGYLLGSGDYEVARGSQAIPSAPRAPIFARQAHPTPYGYAQQQHRFGHDTAPPPSQSLAPVAMSTGAMSVGAMSVGYNTGSHSAQPTMLIADKPSLKWGVLIAVTGAVLGGVLGVGMDAKRQQARAAAAAQAQESAPVVAIAQPAALPPVAMQLAAPKPAVAVAPPAVAAQPAQPTVAAQPAQPAPVVAGATLPPQAPIVIAPASAARQAKAEPAKPAHPPVSHGFVGHRPAPPSHPMVAVKVNPPPPAEKAEPKQPESKPEPKAAAKRTDAQKVLEDAIKNTANTL